MVLVEQPQPSNLLASRIDDTSAGIAIRNDLTFAEVHLDPGVTVMLPTPADHNAFVFIQRSLVATNHTAAATGDAIVFAHDGDQVVVTGADSASFLFGAGRPLNEPAHARGPFIMSSTERLEQATQAFSRGDMGHLESSF